MSDAYKEALEQAQTELRLLEERRANLLRLIANLKALSQDELYELTPPPGYVPEGLTAEIRKILGLTTVHLTPTQIRDSLVQRGFSNEKPKNLLISVHTVLGRIEKELDVIERDGKAAYKATVQVSVLGQKTIAQIMAEEIKRQYEKQTEEMKNRIIRHSVSAHVLPGTATSKKKE
jgi:hypothetical protein